MSRVREINNKNCSHFFFDDIINIKNLDLNKTKIKIFLSNTLDISRGVNMNFLGLGSFLGIRALREAIIYITKKKSPAGKNLRFFLLETLKNCTLNKKFNP